MESHQNKSSHISSKTNPKIKLVQSLHQRKNRQKENKFVIEGTRIVMDAVSIVDSSRFEFVLYDEKFELSDDGIQMLDSLSKSGIQVYSTTSDIIEYASDTKSPQGVIAILKNLEISCGLASHDSDRILLLDGIQDPGNLGTIIRTADAAGFGHVICTKGTVDAYNSKVLRSTMGSIFNVGLTYETHPIDLSEYSKGGYKIVGTALEGAIDYREASIEKIEKLMIVIGNEGNGVSQEVLDQCDVKVKIPIRGMAESLNASIAASILMYKATELQLD